MSTCPLLGFRKQESCGLDSEGVDGAYVSEEVTQTEVCVLLFFRCTAFRLNSRLRKPYLFVNYASRWQMKYVPYKKMQQK